MNHGSTTSQRLVWWIMGALLLAIIGLSGIVLTSIQADIAEMKTDIRAIQAEYSRIAVMESQVSELLRLAREPGPPR